MADKDGAEQGAGGAAGARDEDVWKVLRGPAYTIFFGEVQKHLAGVTVLFEGVELTAPQITEAVGRFHTIRGGAGFFKLVEVASIAGKLEQGLKGLDPAQLHERRAEIDQLIAELRTAVAAMPEPTV
jgi:chemotaxis protein histidine kinase CheA